MTSREIKENYGITEGKPLSHWVNSTYGTYNGIILVYASPQNKEIYYIETNENNVPILFTNKTQALQYIHKAEQEAYKEFKQYIAFDSILLKLENGIVKDMYSQKQLKRTGKIINYIFVFIIIIGILYFILK